jgi:hypothetical protein
VREGIFGGCGPEWKKQFSWRAFKLSNEPKSLFVEPRQYFWLCGFNMHPWQQWTFLLYRFLFLIYWGFWIIYDAIDGSGPKWFVYLTHWNVLLCSIYFLTVFFMTLLYTLFHWTGDQKGLDSYTEEMRKADAFQARGAGVPPSSSGLARAAVRFHTHDYHFNWAYKITWLLHNLCADGSLLIVCVYWTAIASNPGGANFAGGGLGTNGETTSPSNVNVHGVILGLMLLEIAISAIPYRLAHWVYTFIYGCCYAAFTLIYWGAGGTRPDGERYIYKPLDYSGLGGVTAAVLAVALLVIIPLSHIAIWLWHLFWTWFTGALATGDRVDSLNPARLRNQPIRGTELGSLSRKRDANGVAETSIV